MTGSVRIGTSGWQYPRWRGDFYPPGLLHREELAFAAEAMDTLEVNASFYALQRPSTYQRWAEQTPDHFVFAIKGGRFITHLKKLVDVEQALANFFASGVLALGPKLGPVLWQLPARLAFDAERLDHFLGLLPRTLGEAATLAGRHDDKVPADRALVSAAADGPLRHALEPRHDSFGSPEATALLRARDVALVLADSAGTWPQFDAVTSDLVYVRLHGEHELYAGGYSEAALDAWAGRIRHWVDDGRDVLAYFDNDADGRAPHDAHALRERLGG